MQQVDTRQKLDRIANTSISRRRAVQGAAALGIDDLVAAGERWAPWRSYAAMHLWRAAGSSDDDKGDLQ